MNQANDLLQQAEQYSYLWNHPERWRIETHHGCTEHILVRFSGKEGPSLCELTLLRQWLPDLTYVSPIELQKLFKNVAIYDVGTFGGAEGRHLYETGKQLGLDVVSDIQSCKHTIFVCSSCGDIVRIEDKEVNHVVEKKMRDAGCSAVLTEED